MNPSGIDMDALFADIPEENNNTNTNNTNNLYPYNSATNINSVAENSVHSITSFPRRQPSDMSSVDESLLKSPEEAKSAGGGGQDWFDPSTGAQHTFPVQLPPVFSRPEQPPDGAVEYFYTPPSPKHINNNNNNNVPPVNKEEKDLGVETTNVEVEKDTNQNNNNSPKASKQLSTFLAHFVEEDNTELTNTFELSAKIQKALSSTLDNNNNNNSDSCRSKQPHNRSHHHKNNNNNNNSNMVAAVLPLDPCSPAGVASPPDSTQQNSSNSNNNNNTTTNNTTSSTQHNSSEGAASSAPSRSFQGFSQHLYPNNNNSISNSNGTFGSYVSSSRTMMTNTSGQTDRSFQGFNSISASNNNNNNALGATGSGRRPLALSVSELHRQGSQGNSNHNLGSNLHFQAGTSTKNTSSSFDADDDDSNPANASDDFSSFTPFKGIPPPKIPSSWRYLVDLQNNNNSNNTNNNNDDYKTLGFPSQGEEDTSLMGGLQSKKVSLTKEGVPEEGPSPPASEGDGMPPRPAPLEESIPTQHRQASSEAVDEVSSSHPLFTSTLPPSEAQHLLQEMPSGNNVSASFTNSTTSPVTHLRGNNDSNRFSANGVHTNSHTANSDSATGNFQKSASNNNVLLMDSNSVSQIEEFLSTVTPSQHPHWSETGNEVEREFHNNNNNNNNGLSPNSRNHLHFLTHFSPTSAPAIGRSTAVSLSTLLSPTFQNSNGNVTTMTNNTSVEDPFFLSVSDISAPTAGTSVTLPLSALTSPSFLPRRPKKSEMVVSPSAGRSDPMSAPLVSVVEVPTLLPGHHEPGAAYNDSVFSISALSTAIVPPVALPAVRLGLQILSPPLFSSDGSNVISDPSTSRSNHNNDSHNNNNTNDKVEEEEEEDSNNNNNINNNVEEEEDDFGDFEEVVVVPMAKKEEEGSPLCESESAPFTATPSEAHATTTVADIVGHDPSMQLLEFPRQSSIASQDYPTRGEEDETETSEAKLEEEAQETNTNNDNNNSETISPTVRGILKQSFADEASGSNTSAPNTNNNSSPDNPKRIRFSEVGPQVISPPPPEHQYPENFFFDPDDDQEVSTNNNSNSTTMLPSGKGIRPEEGDSGENSFMDEEEPKKVVRKSYAAAAAAAFLSRKKKMEEEEEEKRKQKLEQKHSSKEGDDASPKRQSTSGIESSSSEVILLQNPKMELFAGANKNNADSYAEAPATEEGAPPKDERRSSSAICITLPSFVSPEATKSNNNNNNNSTSDVPAAQANEPLDKTSKSLSGSNALNANNKTWIESVRHSLTQHPMYNINLEALYQRNLNQYHYFYEGKTAPASKLNSISQNEKRGASGDRLDETSTSSTVKRNNKNRKDLNLSEEILYRLEQEQKELLEEEEASATDKENKEENDESFFDSSSTPFTTNNNSSTTNHNSSTGNMDRFINVAELDHTFGIIKKQYRNSAGLLPLYSCYLDHRGRIKRLSRLSHSQEEDDPTARAFRSRKSKSKKRKSLFDALPTPTVTDENKEEEVDVTQPHYQQSPHRHSGESNFNSTLYVLKTLQFSPLHIDEWSWTTTHALQTHMNRIQQQEEVGEEEEEFLAMTQHANKLKGNVTNVAAKYRFCGSDSSDNDDDDSMASDNENHPHHAHHRHASLNEATSSHLSDVESGMRDGEDSLWSHDNPNGSGTKHGISPTTRSTSPPPPSFLSSRGMRSPNNNMANTLFISSGTPGSGDRTHPESRAQEKPMLKPFQNIATLLTSPRGNKTTPRPEDNETSGQWYANSHKRNSFLNFTHGLSKESNSTLSVSHPPKGEGKGGAPPLPPRFALPLAPQSNKLDASLLSPEMSAVPELHSLTVESPAPRRTSLLNCSSAVYVKRGSSEGETLMGGRRQRKNSSNRSSGGRNPSVLHASPPPSQPPQKEALNNSIYSFRETSRSNNPNSSFNNNNMRDVLAVFQHEEEKHRLRSINSLQFSGSNLFPDASGANVNDLARHGNYIPPPALSQTNTNQNNATNNNNNNELNSFASISSSLVPNGGRGKNFVERENLEDVLRRANQTNSSFNLNDTSAMLNRSDGSRSPIREEEEEEPIPPNTAVSAVRTFEVPLPVEEEAAAPIVEVTPLPADTNPVGDETPTSASGTSRRSVLTYMGGYREDMLEEKDEGKPEMDDFCI